MHILPKAYGTCQTCPHSILGKIKYSIIIFLASVTFLATIFVIMFIFFEITHFDIEFLLIYHSDI
jgi:hypothetical protein